MEQSKLSNSSFEFIWGQYRIWTVTAKKLKKSLTMWRIAVFVLTLLGSFTAILSQNTFFENDPIIPKALTWLSATAVGIAGYAGSKILTSEQEKKWLQARAAAETCKSNAYLYFFRINPYGKEDDDVTLFQKIENLIRSLNTIPQATLPAGEELKEIPPSSFSFTNYLEERIHKQVKNYYLPKAALYRRFVKRGGHFGIALGLIGFLLGSYGASNSAGNFSVWIAFISTASASLTTFIATNRYQYLAMSFQVMANQLTILRLKGDRIATDDIEEQKEYVRRCEEILATENEGWLAELSKEEPRQEVSGVISNA